MNDALGRPGSLGQHTFDYQIDQLVDTPASVEREKKTVENGLALQASPTKEEENRIRMYAIMPLEVHGWGLCVSVCVIYVMCVVCDVFGVFVCVV